MTCCICKRDREPFKVIELSEEERRAVQKLSGQEPLPKYEYCKPCWNIATNKQQGPQLMKGMLQYELQRRGVRDAEEFAKKAQDFLIKKATSKPVS